MHSATLTLERKLSRLDPAAALAARRRIVRARNPQAPDDAERLLYSALTLSSLASPLVASPDRDLAREGRAILRAAARLLHRAGLPLDAARVHETVGAASRVSRATRPRHRPFAIEEDSPC
jgi:hypothetical protein